MLISFRHGQMYRYQFDNYALDTLLSFTSVTILFFRHLFINRILSFFQGYYKNFKAERVPKEPTAFDNLLETITQELKVTTFCYLMIIFIFI